MASLRFPRPVREPPVVRHLRPPTPLHFPESELMPESKTHLTVRTFLYQLLQFALGGEHSIGSEQFVYWNAANPRRCLAPDVFVKLDVPDRQFATWKTWEQGGAPELAVEIVSPSDREAYDWSEKIARYHECGVRELVRFDPTAREGARLRVWDRVDEDLVERRIENDRAPCLILGMNWVVCAIDGEPVALRLIDDEGRLLETANERESRARATAEERVRQLEAELRRARGEG